MNLFLVPVLAAMAGFAAGWLAAFGYLHRRERLRARFLSFVAHEINAPVAALNMTVLNFLNGVFGPVSKEHLPWIVMLREQTARLGALTGDLRDLIHVEFHRDLRLNMEGLSLPQALSEALDTMRDSLARAEIPVENRVPSDLPPVRADPERLRRALSAALTHARKFRSEGPIVLRAEKAGGLVALRLEYQGPKIAPEALRDALDLFYPVHNPCSQVLASAGIGLGLSRIILRAHGGDMTLGVDEKGAARIDLRLPAAEGT